MESVKETRIIEKDGQKYKVTLEVSKLDIAKSALQVTGMILVSIPKAFFMILKGANEYRKEQKEIKKHEPVMKKEFARIMANNKSISSIINDIVSVFNSEKPNFYKNGTSASYIKDHMEKEYCMFYNNNKKAKEVFKILPVHGIDIDESPHDMDGDEFYDILDKFTDTIHSNPKTSKYGKFEIEDFGEYVIFTFVLNNNTFNNIKF